jgi:two-component system, sensor histidine kinase
MGLGLAIVERACALLGHPLGLTSQIGMGTCFMVQVPLSDAAADAPRTPPAPRPMARPSMQNRIVFLVENDSDLRRAMGLLLEKWGVSVLDAATGEEALALIDELGILPDCFIVDHNLGEGMDGLRFLAEVGARHGAVAARIMTADRRPDLRAACAEAGIGVMMKPLEPRALEAFVAGLPAAG